VAPLPKWDDDPASGAKIKKMARAAKQGYLMAPASFPPGLPSIPLLVYRFDQSRQGVPFRPSGGA